MNSMKKLLLTTAAFGVLAAPSFAATFNKVADFSFSPAGAAHPMGGAFPYRGAIYGTTLFGGAYNLGALYKYKPGGSVVNQVTILHSFANASVGLPDVVGPQSDVARAGSMLYGVGSKVGEFTVPGVYQFDMATGAEAPLFLWSYTTQGTQPNGVIPLNNLLYGTTSVDGAHVYGTIFAVDPNAITQTALYAFQGGADGGVPIGTPLNLNGILFGTTSQGGTNGGGTIFSFDPASKRKTTLYNFDPAKDGLQPRATLISVGRFLYGSTYAGGRHNAGGIFAFNTATGKVKILHAFAGGPDGQYPVAPLLYSHGLLYGTTSAGGTSGVGTVFSLDTKTQSEKLLHSFSGTDGAGPIGALHMDGGTLYGTTYAGGTIGSGTIFKITP